MGLAITVQPTCSTCPWWDPPCDCSPTQSHSEKCKWSQPGAPPPLGHCKVSEPRSLAQLVPIPTRIEGRQPQVGLSQQTFWPLVPGHEWCGKHPDRQKRASVFDG